MGNSTVTLQSVLDNVSAKGIPNPLNNPTGFGVALALDLADNTMADLLSQRFNWKWNSKNGPTFYTNCYQQDYPLLGLNDVDWLEDAVRIDVNNPTIPKPMGAMIIRRDLSRTSMTGVPLEICWMFNRQLIFGTWPGAGVTFYPLVGASPIPNNPVMSMVDVNGNLLIVTTPGVTGVAAPSLPAAALPGATVTDGSVTWTVVSPDSQGFRVSLVPGNGTTWQMYTKYQTVKPIFRSLDQLIDPIPDNDVHLFRIGYEWQCRGASPNPLDRQTFQREYPIWLKTLDALKRQGAEEMDAFGMYPATYPVEYVIPARNPRDPSQPY
jgi:hypothetical protein